MSSYVQDNMKTIRSILKCTQTELAEKIGVSRPMVSKIESGKMKITRNIIISFVTFVIVNFEKLDVDSIEYSLISVFIENMLSELHEIIIL